MLPLRLAPPPLLVQAFRHDEDGHSMTALAFSLEQRSQTQNPAFVFTGRNKGQNKKSTDIKTGYVVQ